MKTISLVLFLTLTFFSCSKKNENKIDPELVGEWKLTEMLVDPGDGSGTYHSVNSDKTIEFHSDGAFTSNGEICEMSIESNTPSIGTYSLTDSTINSSNCANSAIKIRFKKIGSTLILYYPCIEPCGAKYVKK